MLRTEMFHIEKDRGWRHSLGVKQYAFVLAAIWTLLIVGLSVWGVCQERRNARELILNEARAHFLKDQAFRIWGASHGGVYVPSTDRTPPNPYLSHIPDRDIETTVGLRLTLMNPAYMIRQLMEDYELFYGVKGHITSLNLLRPENVPDIWERTTLESFERGETEVYGFAEIDSELYLRLMQPMIVQQSCLKCHAHQGYKEGDIRGGVSVSVPAGPFLARARKHITGRLVALVPIWLLGLTGIGFGASRIASREHERDRAETTLKATNQQLRASEQQLQAANQKLAADERQLRVANQKLHESEDKYRSLYDNAPLSYQSLNENGCFIDVNPAWLRTLCYKREEVIGKRFKDFLHSDWKAFFEKNFPEFKRCGYIHDVQFKIRHKDGHYVDISVEGCVGYYPDGAFKQTYCVFQNITERKEAEKKVFGYQNRLKSLATELLLAEERERRRIAIYLHDHISQTLALERIGIEGLRKTVGSVDDKVIDELSGMIKIVIENVQSLTFDLSSPTLYKFGLGKAVDELLDDLFGKTEINYKLSHSKPPIQLDNNLSVLLFRCIRELLVNIIKHARAKKVRIAILRDGDNIQITVDDDGIGFDFDQKELSVSRTGGFGLFNIQERISFISGTFDIQSQLGKGSRLILIVPIKTEMDLSKEISDGG